MLKIYSATDPKTKLWDVAQRQCVHPQTEQGQMAGG